MTDSTIQILHPAEQLKFWENRIREGRFQRSLALLTAATSVFSGLEVAYEDAELVGLYRSFLRDHERYLRLLG